MAKKLIHFALLLLLLVSGSLASAQTLPDWRFRNAKDSIWHLCTNPEVFSALLENKLIPDPFYGTNQNLVQWVENENWVFETILPYESIGRLEFTGLDTYARVFLNNHLVLEGNNAFKKYRCKDLKNYLQKRNNRLRIEFLSPIVVDEKKAAELPFIYPADGDHHPKKTSVFTRKPAYHFGWDFASRKVNSSLRELTVIPKSPFYIEELAYTRCEKNTLQVLVSIWAEKSLNTQLQIDLPGLFQKTTEKINLVPGENHLKRTYPITDPQAWFPNGLGTPSLYELSISLGTGKTTTRKKLTVGFKDFKVIQEPDSFGESFRFEVNGQAFFAKGFNYIQTDEDPTEDEVTEWAKMGINTIRVWGGGNYGSDRLYELCDKYGILVWQDFMFANTMYPGDNSFFANVTEEINYQLNRLKSHPSLALWCGNNEVAVAWKNWGWQQTYHYTPADSLKLIGDYHHLFGQILPGLVNQHDSGRYYLSSSPISNWGKPDDFNRGDNHFWGVYHGEMPITAYNQFIPRFASEYGMQSYPSWLTLNTYTDSNNLTLDHPEIAIRQKSYKGNGLLERYIDQYYSKPVHLKDFVLKTQLVQAQAMKTAIEAHRRNPKCAGSLVWQYNDVWPGASWSLVDFCGVKKLAWHAVKKAFQPNMLSIVETGDTLEIWAVLDGPLPLSGALQIRIKDVFGKVVKEDKLEELILKKGSRLIAKIPKIKQRGSLLVSLVDQEKTVAENELFF